MTLAGSSRRPEYLDRSFQEDHLLDWGLDDRSVNAERYSHHREDATQLIRQMWDDFDIDDYERSSRHGSAATKPDMEEFTGETGSWRHRLTVPKPFTMTLRDERNGGRRAAVLASKVEEERRRRDADEMKECNTTFKAKPPPAHIYQPLMDDMERTRDRRSEFMRAHRGELLRQSLQPFKMTLREETKTAKEEKAAVARDAYKKLSSSFQAKPPPPTTYDADVTERLREEELYRVIKGQVRARELLESSSLPPSMAAREREEQQLRQEAAQRAREKRTLRARPLSAGAYKRKVPDFDELYDKFQRHTRAHAPEGKEPPRCKPFHFETDVRSTMPRSRPRSAQPSKSLPKPRSASLQRAYWREDAPPTKTNAASEKRRGHVLRMAAQAEAELEEERRQNLQPRPLDEATAKFRKRKEDKALKKAVLAGVSARPPSGGARRSDLSVRDREYARQLREMKEKIRTRPLLAEQQVMKDARRRAEQKYDDVVTGLQF